MSAERVGATADGTPIDRWTLERAGTRLGLLTYGGTVQSVEIPDRDGRTVNVALGFPDVQDYPGGRGRYLGALVGRYANRIAGASFTLDGTVHRLTANEGPNTLHGGDDAFDRRVWDAEPAGPYGVRLSLVSQDGEEGFPGRVELSATYTLDEDGALRIDYRAVTDAPTHLNLTNHTYWNLGGEDSGPATGHELRIAAGRITPVDGSALPTGELTPVDATRFDFRERRRVGPGYDHNFVLDAPASPGSPAAELYDPVSGRLMTITTTEPGIQLYTGDHFDGQPYGPCAGIALETQHFPDSPNQPSFPSTVLRPGEVFTSTTTYGFAVQ
ncbi:MULTISPECIES: aldose epimerase family protein [unclassified Streptomyces]|uniref:aldose epimerase family protein n=1 Tax=unclassified Streptomyces TaxID=2593676 RepID=UPI00380C8882